MSVLRWYKGLSIAWQQVCAASFGLAELPADVSTFEASPTTSSFDLAALERSMNGEQAQVRAIVRVFLDEGPLQMAAIRAAVDERDAVRIRAAAHTLKGSAGYLRATGVVEAARELEEVGGKSELEKAAVVYRRLDTEMTRLLYDLRKLQEQPV